MTTPPMLYGEVQERWRRGQKKTKLRESRRGYAHVRPVRGRSICQGASATPKRHTQVPSDNNQQHAAQTKLNPPCWVLLSRFNLRGGSNYPPPPAPSSRPPCSSSSRRLASPPPPPLRIFTIRSTCLPSGSLREDVLLHEEAHQVTARQELHDLRYETRRDENDQKRDENDDDRSGDTRMGMGGGCRKGGQSACENTP